MKYEELNKYRDDLWEMEIRLKRKNKIEQILKIYTVLGALTALLSISYFLFSLFDFKLTQSQTIALSSAVLGIVFSFSSRAFLLFRKQRHEEELEKFKSLNRASNLMYLWGEFEHSAKEKLESKDIEFSKRSIRSVLSSLLENNFLTKKDIMLLENAMQLRNSIAHSRLGSEVSEEVIEKTSKVLVDIINKLESKNT